jgi:hypothetical protein
LTESAQGNQDTPHDRGVEEGTNMSKGTENVEQHGSLGDIGDVDADRGDTSGETHGEAGGDIESLGQYGVGSTPTMAPPEPDPMGVRK